MSKSTTTRIAVFVASLGASAALIGAAATTTGAYFTDSKDGNLNASSGHLKLNQVGDYNLSYNDLVPGEYQDKVVRYTTDSSTNEDVWLQFPAGTGYDRWTGQKGSTGAPDGGLGRYGHFEVRDNAGNLLFSSYNLQNEAAGKSGCADKDGHGYGRAATSETDTDMGYCGVPEFIKIESNLPSGADRTFKMTFGITGKAKGQNSPVASVPFKVVATQAGVRPDAKNF